MLDVSHLGCSMFFLGFPMKIAMLWDAIVYLILKLCFWRRKWNAYATACALLTHLIATSWLNMSKNGRVLDGAQPLLQAHMNIMNHEGFPRLPRISFSVFSFWKSFATRTWLFGSAWKSWTQIVSPGNFHQLTKFCSCNGHQASRSSSKSLKVS